MEISPQIFFPETQVECEHFATSVTIFSEISGITMWFSHFPQHVESGHVNSQA